MFLLITLLCTASVETPDPLDGVYVAIEDIILTPLSDTEIVRLETARFAYWNAVKDSFLPKGYPLDYCSNSMRAWLKETMDSIYYNTDKAPGTYRAYVLGCCTSARTRFIDFYEDSLRHPEHYRKFLFFKSSYSRQWKAVKDTIASFWDGYFAPWPLSFKDQTAASF